MLDFSRSRDQLLQGSSLPKSEDPGYEVEISPGGIEMFPYINTHYKQAGPFAGINSFSIIQGFLASCLSGWLGIQEQPASFHINSPTKRDK